MEKNMKKIKAVIIMLIILLLSGCTGTEVNDVAYVVAIGFDMADNDNYKITVQFAKPTQISGGASEEGGKGGEIIENVTVEAPNIYSGINIANNIVSKKFSLSHAKLMVFSKEVAENGLRDIMETVVRSYEIRPDMYLAVAIDSAEQYLSEVKPVIEVNPAKYYQLTYEEKGGTGIPKNIAQEFYFCENRLYHDGVLPIAGTLDTGNSSESSSSEDSSGGSDGESGDNSDVSRETSENSESEKQKNVPVNNTSFEYKLKNYIAGEVAVQETNKSEAMGMALFKENKMVGIMGGIESELYNILNGTFKYGYVSFFSEKSPDTPITVKLQERKKPKITVDTDKKKINVKLYLESDLYSLPADYITEYDLSNFENQSKKTIEEACEKFINKTINEYNVDILGFVRKAKRNYLTYQSFENEDWSSCFADYAVNVDAEFYVRHSGLTMREDTTK
jgi:spore germination protein KC